MGFMDTLQGVLGSVMDFPNKAMNTLGNLGKKAGDAATQELHKVHKVYNATEAPKVNSDDYIDPLAILENAVAFNDDIGPPVNYEEALDDLVSDMLNTLQDMDGENTPLPIADTYITAFEVPVNESGNYLVEIVEDATGKTIDLFQEIENATEKAKNMIHNTTQKVLGHPTQEEVVNYYNLSIIILLVTIAALALGAMTLYCLRSKKREKVVCNNKSGVYDVEEATKNNNLKKDLPNFHNVSLA